ncbi:MAG: hypothetical protein AAF214_11325, partial [Pseudomonadota bacterium]
RSTKTTAAAKPEPVVAEPEPVAEAPVAEVVEDTAPVPAPAPEPVVAEAVAPDEPPKPKKRGWWSLGK